MEAPLLVIKAWLMCLASIYVYRRYFERVGPRVPEFEALCASGPLLAALRCSEARSTAVASALGRALGVQAQTVATLGGWPWPNYALSVELRPVAGGIHIYCVQASVLYTRQPSPIALTQALRAVVEELPQAIDDVWIDARTVFDFRREPPRGGYRLPAATESPRPEPLAERPSWLVRAAPAQA